MFSSFKGGICLFFFFYACKHNSNFVIFRQCFLVLVLSMCVKHFFFMFLAGLSWFPNLVRQLGFHFSCTLLKKLNNSKNNYFYNTFF